MSVPTLGVIGGGFVGGSFVDGFKHYTDTKLFDIDPKRGVHTYEEVLDQDVIVVALPTPMRKDGTVDVSIVDKALDTLNKNLESRPLKPVLLRSTVPPDQLIAWEQRFENFVLVFCPEFLTERTARLDFQQASRFIFGVGRWFFKVGSGFERNDVLDRVEELFEYRFPMVPQHWVQLAEASLIKYFTNVFFSTKVALLNEFCQVCDEYDLDFNEVFGRVMLDQRIGRSHFQVPGHDGKMGFGGHCFPKDLNGYIKIAEGVGVDPKVSRAAWKKNLEVRPERDWEADKGRAVSEED